MQSLNKKCKHHRHSVREVSLINLLGKSTNKKWIHRRRSIKEISFINSLINFKDAYLHTYHLLKETNFSKKNTYIYIPIYRIIYPIILINLIYHKCRHRSIADIS